MISFKIQIVQEIEQVKLIGYLYPPKGHTAHYWEDLSLKLSIVAQAKKDCNKFQTSLVSVEGFCDSTGLKYEHIEPHIKG